MRLTLLEVDFATVGDAARAAIDELFSEHEKRVQMNQLYEQARTGDGKTFRECVLRKLTSQEVSAQDVAKLLLICERNSDDQQASVITGLDLPPAALIDEALGHLFRSVAPSEAPVFLPQTGIDPAKTPWVNWARFEDKRRRPVTCDRFIQVQIGVWFWRMLFGESIECRADVPWYVRIAILTTCRITGLPFR